jgi:hypothetical protein
MRSTMSLSSWRHSEVDDELELVETLEVSDLRLVTRFDERFETRLDERADPAAEDRLFPEKIGLGFLGEGCLDDSGAGDADPLAV